MTWYIDPGTGDVYMPDGTVLGNAGDEPYSIPADIRTVYINERLPAENASVRGELLAEVLTIAADNCELGTPPEDTEQS